MTFRQRIEPSWRRNASRRSWSVVVEGVLEPLDRTVNHPRSLVRRKALLRGGHENRVFPDNGRLRPPNWEGGSARRRSPSRSNSRAGSWRSYCDRRDEDRASAANCPRGPPRTNFRPADKSERLSGSERVSSRSFHRARYPVMISTSHSIGISAVSAARCVSNPPFSPPDGEQQAIKAVIRVSCLVIREKPWPAFLTTRRPKLSPYEPPGLRCVCLPCSTYCSSTPARAKRLAPRPDSPLTHFASPRGEKCRLKPPRSPGCPARASS